ncbi:MAG: hypothetical protein QF578_22475 [Alphaproteobacteria bacterium]|nr:hypothetical protein [Alphaproteobacteria bacterium]
MAAAAAVTFLAVSSAQAVTVRWVRVDNATHPWDDACNNPTCSWWTDSGGGGYHEPAFGDTVRIRRFSQSEHPHWGPSPYTIDIEANTLYISAKDWTSGSTKTGDGQHLYLTERTTGNVSNGTFLTVNNLEVGYTDQGDVTVNQYSGANEQSLLTTGAARVGYGLFGDGKVTVDGDLSQWDANGTTYIGHSGGEGLVEIKNEGRWESQTVRLGYTSGSEGEVKLSGQDTVWVTKGVTTLGYSGNGTGDVSIDAKAGMYLGSSLSIGRYGDGDLDVSSYGLLTDDNPPAGYGGGGGGDDHHLAKIYIGEQSTGVGALSVHDAGSGLRSTIENGGTIYVGHRGEGTFSVYGGGEFQGANVTIGTYGGATGSAQISHADSIWNQTDTLTIGDAGTGTFYADTGGVTVDTGDVILGKQSGGDGTAYLDGDSSSQESNWDSAGTVTVGAAGTGELNIGNHARLESDNGTLGELSGGDGTVNVDGWNASWAALNKLIVGGAGTGVLNITGGAIVHGTTASGNEVAVVANDGGSSGTVNLTGSNARWTNQSGFQVGLGGQALVDIQGGIMSGSGGDIDVGVLSGSDGKIIVDGSGGRLTAGGALNVGIQGQGTIEASGGARIESTGGVIDSNGTQTGVVDLTGSGTRWDSSGNLDVGQDGKGSLTIEAGAVVTSVKGQVAVNNGSEGTVDIDGSGTAWNASGDLRLGFGGTATVQVTGGATLSSDQNVFVGDGGTGEGTVTVSGANSTLSGTTLVVGYFGQGDVDVQNQGQLDTTNGYIGYYGNAGSDVDTVALTGSGSRWQNSGSMIVGRQGAASLSVGSGSQVDTNTMDVGQSVQGTLTVGGTANVTGALTLGGTGGTGDATVTGQLNTGSLVVGNAGTGSLLVENGGTVDNGLAIMANASGTNAVATVRGSGSTWDNSNDLKVGTGGTATLHIQTGGRVTNRDAIVGGQGSAPGTGTVNVSGSSTTWASSRDVIIGDNGAGTVNISGGTATVAGDTSVRGSGTLNLTGGLLWTQDFTLQNGSTFYHNAGTLRVDGGTYTPLANQDVVISGSNPFVHLTNGADLDTGTKDLIVATGTKKRGTLTVDNGSTVASRIGTIGTSGGGGTVTVTGSGSRWDLSSTLAVGNSGNGTLNVDDSAVVRNSLGVIGSASGAVGAVTVDGGAWQNTGSLYVGNQGSGNLTVRNGGSVTSSTSFIGAAGSGAGVASVTGSGSTWVMNKANLNIGHDGTGSLAILSGGEVSNAKGYIGGNSGGDGTVTVSGISGGTWHNNGLLTVGGGGTGVLNLYSGLVTSSGASIGADSGGSGTANVSGASATWTDAGDMTVGDYGSGRLNILNGAGVSTGNAHIGRRSGGDGRVDVASGAAWQVQGNLFLGQGDTGVLNILSGGSVTDVNTTTVGASGLMTVDGGSIDTGNLLVDSGIVDLKSSNGIVDTAAVTIQGGSFNLVGGISEVIKSLDIQGGKATLDGGTLGTSLGTEITGTGVLEGHGTVNGDVLNNGFVDGGTSNQWLAFAGDVTGSGDFGGNTRFEGSYGPGDGGADLIDMQNVVFAGSNTLLMELGGLSRGSAYDALNITGSLNLGGLLEVSLFGSFNPLLGNAFDLLDFDPQSLIGTFDALDLPSLAVGLLWDIADLYNTGVIRVVAQSSSSVPVPAAPWLLPAVLGLLAWRRFAGRACAN